MGSCINMKASTLQNNVGRSRLGPLARSKGSERCTSKTSTIESGFSILVVFWQFSCPSHQSKSNAYPGIARGRSNWVSWKIQSHAGFYKVTGMIVPSILESIRVSYSHGGDILMSLLTDSYLENKKLVHETVEE
jgi:hypothetical protein